MARSLVCLYLLCTLLLSLYSAIPIAHAQEQANNDDSSLRAHLCAKQESTNNNYSSGAVPMQEAIPVSGIQNRHLQLFFNVTHNFGQASQEAARTRLHLELHDICTDTTAKYATYIISIYDAKNGPANASATKPIIRDIFQTASGILNLDIIDDGQAQIRIYGERDEIVNAWKADTANNSIMVKTSAIRPEATYRMELELAGIDYPTKIFAEEQSPKSTLEWDPTHTSNKIMLNPTDAGLQKSGFPYEPVTFLRTDKQHYQSGDTVSVFGNVGNGSAKALKEHKENPVRIGVLGADPQQQFVLMDNISNITDPGNFTYSFPMKGLGTIQTGRFSVQIWSPNGAQAATTYNFTYSAKEALSSNPMTVDWNDAATKHTFARVYDDRYVTNGSRLLSQSSELVFSREMRYKIIPEGSADLENLTGHHQKDGSGSTLFTILEGRLKAQRNGTLIIDIPIDVVEPDPLKVRGLEWRMLNGTAPFSVDGYGGQQRTRLLYYDEVQNVVAIEFGPGTGLFHVVGKSAEPITDSELQSGYVVPEFDSAFLVATIGLCSVVTIALVGRNQLSAK